MAKKKLPKRATRKKLKLLFISKLTRAQIIFNVIFLIIIFVGLGLFFFATNTGLQYRMLINSKLQQANGNFYDYTQSLTHPNNLSPHWSPCGQFDGNDRCASSQHTYTFFIHATAQKITKPTGLNINESDSAHTFTVNIGTLVDVDFGRVGNFHVTVTSPQNIFQCVGSGCLPHSSPPDSIYDNWVTRQGSAIIQVETNTPEPSPTPTPSLVTSTHQPNKLVVTRQEDTSFYITVSNPALVKKIYDDILQLPVYTGMYKCPQDSANTPVYILTFYQYNKLTDTAVLTTTGCRTVTIDNYPARLDNGFLSSFDTDFQKATGL